MADATTTQPSGAAATDDVWTTRRLLEWMLSAFRERAVPEPRRTAELLLEQSLGCTRMSLYTQPERPATAEERAALRKLVLRALEGEPPQYLLGEWSFFGRTYTVDRRVLIPRPCTELIPEEVLKHARTSGTFGKQDRAFSISELEPEGGAASEQQEAQESGAAEAGVSRPEAGPRGEGLWIADVGTGSGCIAVSLLAVLTGARCVAVDRSAEALEVARTNAERHGVVDRLELIEGDLLNPLSAHGGVRSAGGLDYLLSNPPYIPDVEWEDPTQMDAHVKRFEPELALRGGVDGLRFVGPLIDEGPALLKRGGVLMVEIASSTAGAVLARAQGNAMLRGARIVKDLEGLPRLLVAERA